MQCLLAADSSSLAPAATYVHFCCASRVTRSSLLNKRIRCTTEDREGVDAADAGAGAGDLADCPLLAVHDRLYQ
jgi:hypothetical protein